MIVASIRLWVSYFVNKPNVWARICASSEDPCQRMTLGTMRLLAPLDIQPPLAPKTPVYVSSRRHYATDLVTEFLLQRRPPRHELEPHPIIDHGEPAGGEGDALAVDAGHVLAFSGGAMCKSRLRREHCGDIVQFAPAQRVEEVPREPDALALPLR